MSKDTQKENSNTQENTECTETQEKSSEEKDKQTKDTRENFSQENTDTKAEEETEVATETPQEDHSQEATEPQEAQPEEKDKQTKDTRENSSEENADTKAEEEIEVAPESPQEDLSQVQDEAENELITAREELQNMKDKYLRLYAEFENYQRRTSKEKVSIVALANEQLIESLLPVLDDFERSLQFETDSSKEASAEKGISLIYQKFKNILEKKGLKVMESSVGKEFDPELHEALTQIPAPDESQKGKVLDEVEKGYLLKDKIIRYPKVVVGQ